MNLKKKAPDRFSFPLSSPRAALAEGEAEPQTSWPLGSAPGPEWSEAQTPTWYRGAKATKGGGMGGRKASCRESPGEAGEREPTGPRGGKRASEHGPAEGTDGECIAIRTPSQHNSGERAWRNKPRRGWPPGWTVRGCVRRIGGPARMRRWAWMVRRGRRMRSTWRTTSGRSCPAPRPGPTGRHRLVVSLSRTGARRPKPDRWAFPRWRIKSGIVNLKQIRP